MITLLSAIGDDLSFVEFVERILNSAVELYNPHEIYAIQVDSWFDDKWLAFSGKSLGAVGWWNKMLTVPPFNPHRIINQTYYQASNDNSKFYELSKAKPLHIKQPSGNNLHRYLKLVTNSGIFIWYSGSTKTSGRGSVLFYRQEREAESIWYASFKKERDWTINSIHGTSKKELLSLAKLASL